MMRIKNWSKFQHYHTGRGAPPWIKLYRDLLNDKDWFALPGDAAKFLVNVWLIAAENNGEVPDSETLAFRLRLASKDISKYISLCSDWLIDDASNTLADRYQVDSPETETETETETEGEVPTSKVPARKSQRVGDFVPDDTAKRIASDLGVDLSSEVQKFRDHHQSKGNTFKDVQAAFRNWLRKAAEWKGGKVVPMPAGARVVGGVNLNAPNAL